MISDLQKASLWKRVSALLFDLILLVTMITGCSAGLSAALNYNQYNEALDGYYTKYEAEFDVTFDIPYEEYEAMSAEEKEKYDTAYEALASDPHVTYAYGMLMSNTLLIITFSILIAYLILEFAIPLWLGNGQTLGKKIFGIAVMRTGGIKVTPVCLFIRTVLGKFTVETMIPVLMVLMLYFSTIGMVGLLILVAVPLGQLISLVVTRTNSAIHDLLADTVTVDFASQMIFTDEQARTDYLKKIAAQEAQKKSY